MDDARRDRGQIAAAQTGKRVRDSFTHGGVVHCPCHRCQAM
jgi:hypothetical protein